MVVQYILLYVFNIFYMMKLIFRIIIIIVGIYLMYKYLLSNEMLWNISFAESYDEYGRVKLTDWDKRYNSKYNDYSYLNIITDVTLCAVLYGLFVLASIWK